MSGGEVERWLSADEARARWGGLIGGVGEYPSLEADGGVWRPQVHPETGELEGYRLDQDVQFWARKCERKEVGADG